MFVYTNCERGDWDQLPVLSLLQDPHWVQALRFLDRRDAVLLLLHLEHGGHLLPGGLRGHGATRHGARRPGGRLRGSGRGPAAGGRSQVLVDAGLIVANLTCRSKGQSVT